MGLTTRPTRKTDLSKIDEIQEEFFKRETATEEKARSAAEEPSDTKAQSLNPETANKSNLSPANSGEREVAGEETGEKTAGNANLSADSQEAAPLTIADLLQTTQTGGVRYSSRPYTVPRSLTIDLNRLKAKFKTRDLQYTQNELTDQMIREVLQTVTAENYQSLREKAYGYVKSPEQSSRRTVTLTEATVGEMAELKARLTLSQNRRVSSDELFTSLLAIAFIPLYEKGLL